MLWCDFCYCCDSVGAYALYFFVKPQKMKIGHPYILLEKYQIPMSHRVCILQHDGRRLKQRIEYP